MSVVIFLKFIQARSESYMLSKKFVRLTRVIFVRRIRSVTLIRVIFCQKEIKVLSD